MKKETIKATVQVTDTIGGEANYAWGHEWSVKARTEKGLIRAAKKAAGWTGIRCRKANIGEMIALYPAGMCQVMFIE